MSFSKEQLMTALRNADAAGDEEAARRIAQMVKSLEENGTEESPVITPTKTSFISRDEDGDRIFDDLLQDTKYADALRKWGGPDKSLEELREDSFEYFNSTMNNELSLADTVYDISQMNDDQKDNLKYLYDAYNETAVTGEGSRSGWEQFKDAGDLLWAPTTWLGGKFIAAPALKTASKAAIKAAFKGTATAAQKK